MMNDYLISREKAIESIATVKPYTLIQEEGHLYAIVKLMDIIDKIYQIPHAKPEQAVEFLFDENWLEEHDHVITTNWWIPVSYALPEKDGEYLVTMHEFGNIGFEYDEYQMKIMTFTKGAWRLPVSMPQWVEDALTKEVIAWMPLPKPYERKEE